MGVQVGTRLRNGNNRLPSPGLRDPGHPRVGYRNPPTPADPSWRPSPAVTVPVAFPANGVSDQEVSAIVRAEVAERQAAARDYDRAGHIERRAGSGARRTSLRPGWRWSHRRPGSPWHGRGKQIVEPPRSHGCSSAHRTSCSSPARRRRPPVGEHSAVKLGLPSDAIAELDAFSAAAAACQHTADSSADLLELIPVTVPELPRQLRGTSSPSPAATRRTATPGRCGDAATSTAPSKPTSDGTPTLTRSHGNDLQLPYLMPLTYQ